MQVRKGGVSEKRVKGHVSWASKDVRVWIGRGEGKTQENAKAQGRGVHGGQDPWVKRKCPSEVQRGLLSSAPKVETELWTRNLEGR